jgi:Xaa-Pro aminopeptidase
MTGGSQDNEKCVITQLILNYFPKTGDRLIEHLPQKCLSVLNANDLMPSNADGTLPYHPNSDLFYLAGVEQEESILLLHPGANKASERAHLFIRKPNPTLLIWEGYKLNKTDARKISGISKCTGWRTSTRYSPNWPAIQGPFYLNDNEHQRADNPVETRDQRFRNFTTQRYPKRKFLRLAPHLHALRFVKEPREIELIKQAVK